MEAITETLARALNADELMDRLTDHDDCAVRELIRKLTDGEASENAELKERVEELARDVERESEHASDLSWEVEELEGKVRKLEAEKELLEKRLEELEAV